MQIIAEQSLRQITVHADRLHEAFRGLVFDDKILDQVGPAVNSGRSIFLYGPPGNGKTSICERIVKSFGGSIFIPYAVEVKGSIIKRFRRVQSQADRARAPTCGCRASTTGASA